jgi:hypothetical protein
MIDRTKIILTIRIVNVNLKMNFTDATVFQFAYHFGYPEYRVQGGVVGPSIGNGVMTFGYILTNNPIAAVFSHIAMHIAGVLQGPATVMQLPPHY